MKSNERMQSLGVLLALNQHKTPLNHLLAAESNLTPLAKEICFGVCRHYFQLQALANSLLQKKPKSDEIWMVILMGLYQLHFMRQPDYAVVKETVALLDHGKNKWAKGLVNAVLRNSTRQYEALILQLQKQADYRFNHPDWLLKCIKKNWPHHWEQILDANDQHPPMTLRVNRLKSTRADYLQKLLALDIKAKAHPYAKDAIILEKPTDVTQLPGFHEGLLSVQDAAAQLAASLLDLKPQHRVLDACCAPGGKTCHILETEPTIKACIALDVDAKRLLRVNDNLKRLNLKASVLQGDGQEPLQWWDGQTFDRILLDAPCTATGVIRRHPDIKLLRQPHDLKAITQIQARLLERLWPLLAPGGKLLYATCSILPEENEQQIAAFISRHKDCIFTETNPDWGHATGHGWQIFPGEHDMDGFFYSLLGKDEK